MSSVSYNIFKDSGIKYEQRIYYEPFTNIWGHKMAGPGDHQYQFLWVILTSSRHSECSCFLFTFVSTICVWVFSTNCHTIISYCCVCMCVCACVWLTCMERTRTETQLEFQKRVQDVLKSEKAWEGVGSQEYGMKGTREKLWWTLPDIANIPFFSTSWALEILCSPAPFS